MASVAAEISDGATARPRLFEGGELSRDERQAVFCISVYSQIKPFNWMGVIMGEKISLRSLKVGQRAVVKTVAAAGEMGRRIRDMGLVPGCELEVMGRAPLRDPVALRLGGFTLTLRNNEADYIAVEIT